VRAQLDIVQLPTICQTSCLGAKMEEKGTAGLRVNISMLHTQQSFSKLCFSSILADSGAHVHT